MIPANLLRFFPRNRVEPKPTKRNNISGRNASESSWAWSLDGSISDARGAGVNNHRCCYHQQTPVLLILKVFTLFYHNFLNFFCTFLLPLFWVKNWLMLILRFLQLWCGVRQQQSIFTDLEIQLFCFILFHSV